MAAVVGGKFVDADGFAEGPDPGGDGARAHARRGEMATFAAAAEKFVAELVIGPVGEGFACRVGKDVVAILLGIPRKLGAVEAHFVVGDVLDFEEGEFGDA